MGIRIEYVVDEETGEVIARETREKRWVRNKGKSLLEFPNEYVVVDVETTGLSRGTIT